VRNDQEQALVIDADAIEANEAREILKESHYSCQLGV
jgi:hypothetical protein